MSGERHQHGYDNGTDGYDDNSVDNYAGSFAEEDSGDFHIQDGGYHDFPQDYPKDQRSWTDQCLQDSQKDYQRRHLYGERPVTTGQERINEIRKTVESQSAKLGAAVTKKTAKKSKKQTSESAKREKRSKRSKDDR